MAIQMQHDINLNDAEIKRFLRDSNQLEMMEVPRPKAGYNLSTEFKNIGIAQEIDPATPLSSIWFKKEFYQLVEGRPQGQVVGRFDISIPVRQNFSIEIFARLYTKNGLAGPSTQLIENLFKSYSFAVNGDPNDYMQAQLTGHPSVKASDFEIIQVFKLVKTGAPIEDETQKRSMLALYSGGGTGTIWPNPTNLPPNRPPHDPGPAVPAGGEDGGYFGKRRLRARFVPPSLIVDEPDPIDQDPHVISDGTDPIDKIKELIKNAAGVLDCSVVSEPHNHRVMELFRIPEFRIEWRLRFFRIGCVDIGLHLPVLQIRISSMNLFYYVQVPNDPAGYLLTIVKNCALSAAVTGAVVGVVLWNFVAALAAFEAVFTECIEGKIGEYVVCLLPGLLLSKIVEIDWKDVL